MRACILAITLATSILCQFSNPPAERAAWTVGETQTIKFETKFETYSIALWQQALEGDWAKLGPIVFETSNNQATHFDWIVQTYGLNLTDSNVFFFWMSEGPSSLQGNKSNPQISSAYFNITDADPASPSSTLTPPPPSNASNATTTTPSASLSPTTASGSIDNEQTGDPESSGRLSVGAKAGVGISVAAVGVAAICGASFLYTRKKRQPKQQHYDEQQFPEPSKQTQDGSSQSIMQEPPFKVPLSAASAVPPLPPKRGPYELPS